MREFEVEFKGKMEKLILASPTVGIKKELRNKRILKAKELEPMREKANNPEKMSSEELILVMDKTDEMDGMLNEIIVKLSVPADNKLLIKNVQEIENISNHDVEKIHSWILEECGLSTSKKEEGFTKT